MCLFIGYFGSGKTEIALSQALAWAQAGEKALYVDLDIVNPYFRGTVHKAELEAHGIRSIHPRFAATGVDVPSLPPEVEIAFLPESGRVAVDVGGDEAGSVALGRYHAQLVREDPDVFFVLNALRPFTNTLSGARALLERICARARVQPTAIIHNTNIAAETTAEVVVQGHALAEALSSDTGLPIRAVTVLAELIPQLPEALRALAVPLERRMRPEWGS